MSDPPSPQEGVSYSGSKPPDSHNGSKSTINSRRNSSSDLTTPMDVDDKLLLKGKVKSLLVDEENRLQLATCLDAL